MSGKCQTYHGIFNEHPAVIAKRIPRPITPINFHRPLDEEFLKKFNNK